MQDKNAQAQGDDFKFFDDDYKSYLEILKDLVTSYKNVKILCK
jgi:hypothetical protein